MVSLFGQSFWSWKNGLSTTPLFLYFVKSFHIHYVTDNSVDFFFLFEIFDSMFIKSHICDNLLIRFNSCWNANLENWPSNHPYDRIRVFLEFVDHFYISLRYWLLLSCIRLGLNDEMNSISLEDFLQLDRSPLALFLKAFNFVMLTTLIKFSTSLCYL